MTSDAQGDVSNARVAVLTARGRGAVAVVAVSGELGTAAIGEHFESRSGTPVAEFPQRKIRFGTWRSSPADAGEEIVVVRLADHHWELQCHGGIAAVDAIVAALERHGVARVEPDALAITKNDADCLDAIRRSACADDSPITAAARQLLPHTRTPLTAAALLHQVQGALQRELESLVDILRGDAPQTALPRLARLAATAPAGLHLTRPWRVALVGLPNAGKSSLINRLVGYERAIVAEIPGTTRDVVTALAAAGGWPLELADTAGIRATDDALEAAGVARSRQQRSDADLVLLVADASLPWSESDETLHRESPHAIVVHNKSDLPTSDSRARPDGFPVSALTGASCDRLLDEIVRRLVPPEFAVDAPLVFTIEQRDAITASLEAAHANRPSDVANSLARLL